MPLPIHILLVSPRLPPQGGISVWTEQILSEARQHPDAIIDNLNTAPHWRGTVDFRIWKRLAGGGIQFIRDFVSFFHSLKSKPDVIHLTSSGHLAFLRDVVLLFVAHRRSIPAVYHLHFGRVPQICKERNWEWRLLIWAIGMAKTVILLDPATKSSLQLYFPHVRSIQVPNGLDLKQMPIAVSTSSRRKVLFLGWVVPAKGIEELMKAWSEMNHEGWSCVIAGAGSDDYRNELLRRYAPTDLELLPEQSHADAMRLLANTDIFVLPSHSEGFPYVIVEAMALGRAIVATDVGAIPEMLADGCGEIVPAKNVQALATALNHLMLDQIARKKMGALAKAKAHREYAIEYVFDQLMGIWRSCLH